MLPTPEKVENMMIEKMGALPSSLLSAQGSAVIESTKITFDTFME